MNKETKKAADKDKIVFEYDFGDETFGKIEYNSKTEKYECFETPQYGGDFYRIGSDFDDLHCAKLFLMRMI